MGGGVKDALIGTKNKRRIFVIFGGLECVGQSFAYVAHFFIFDVWIRIQQSAALASWRATDLATHPSFYVKLEDFFLDKIIWKNVKSLDLKSFGSCLRIEKATSPLGSRHKMSRI